MSNEYYDFREFYTLFFEQIGVNLKSVFTLAWNNSISNINVVIKSDNESEWKIFTYYPFSNEICGNSAPVEINKYTLFPVKIKNLHNCSLKFPKLNYYPGLIIEEYKNGTRIAGIDGDIMMELSKIFNFSLDILKLKYEEERWGVVNENGNHTGAVKMVVDKEVDFMLGLMALTLLRVKYMDSTSSFISFPFVLVIPPGMEFSPFEKLFRPFSKVVWIILIFTFSCGFTFIFLTLKFSTKELRTKIFGEIYRTPYLNMMNIFFGGTLHVFPLKSAPRFLLTAFILYCIIMRTVYQGLLFKFLQADDRHRPVMTVDELVENNYNVYMYPVYVEHSKHLKFFPRRILIKDSEFEKYLKMTLNSNFKGAITSSLDEVLYFNMLNYKNYTYNVLPEYLYYFNYVIYFQKNSPFLKAFDEKMSLFKSSGLVDHWTSKYLNSMYLNMQEIQNGPRKLNLKQLQGGFQMWLIGCGLSCFIFILEVIYMKIKQCLL